MSTPPAPAAPPRTKASSLRQIARILFTGQPGKGKTSHAAHLAKLGPVVFINSENRLKPEVLQRQFGIDLDNIEVWPAEGEPFTFDGAYNLALELKAVLQSDRDAYTGVIFDGYPEAQKLLLEQSVDTAVAKSRARGTERAPLRAEWDERGEVAEQMRRLLRRFKELPCHLAITANVRRDQDDDGMVSYGPAVTASVSGDLNGYMDAIGYCSTSPLAGWGPYGELFVARFRNGGKYVVKDDRSLLPTLMVEPSMDRVIAYMNGELTEDTDPVLAKVREMQANQPAPEAQAETAAASEGAPAAAAPVAAGAKPKLQLKRNPALQGR